jgi:hypothetical protein
MIARQRSTGHSALSGSSDVMGVSWLSYEQRADPDLLPTMAFHTDKSVLAI